MRTAILALIIVASSLIACGCATRGTTPTGYPCTKPPSQANQTDDCYYIISNGKAIPCKVSGTNLCQNTKGTYYDYSGYYDQTYLCEDHWACWNSKPVTVPRLCSPKYGYDNLVDDGQAWQVVNQQADQNSSRRPITIRFTSTSATIISTSIGAGITVGASGILGIVFASVQAHINASVTRTVSTKVGNAVTVTIPARVTAYGVYGVRVQVARGHLYQKNSCGAAKPDYGDVRTYVPIASGWCIWLSGQTPCRIVPKA